MDKPIVSRFQSRTTSSTSDIAVLTLLFLLFFLSEVIPATGHDVTLNIFQAGAATGNITPPLGTSLTGSMQDRKASHVHDELKARAVILDDSRNQLAIVVVDNCMIPREIFDEAKRRVHKRTGIPVGHILMSATHTHSGGTVAHVFQSKPDAGYIEFLKERIADGETPYTRWI